MQLLVRELQLVNPNCIGGGGGDTLCDAKLSKKCLCSQINNIAFIKQISLFVLHEVMTNT